MIYRSVEYSIWEKNFIKLFHKEGVRKEVGGLLRNGELYVSIPPAWELNPVAYAKRYIDNLYSTAEYHKKQEMKGKLK